jgi:hypothetical protein
MDCSMRPSFALWLQRYVIDIADAGRMMRESFNDWTLPPGSDDQIRFLHEIQDVKWQRLLEAGREVREARAEGLASIATHQERLSSLWSQRPTATKAARRLVAPNQQDDYLTTRNSMHSMLSERGFTADETDSALRFLDALDPSDAVRTFDEALRQLTDEVESAADVQTRSAMAATLAIAVSRFNIAIESPKSLNDAPDAYAAIVLSDLDERERELWRSLRAEDRFLTWGIARDLREVAGRRLLLGAVPHAAQLAVQRASVPDDAELGEQALLIGNVIRRLLRSVALGLSLESACRWPTDAPPFRYWSRLATRASRSGSAWRWPFRTTPANVMSTATRSEGRPRTVEGRVSSISIHHRARKAISRVTIERDGAQIDAVIGHIKADSGGLVPGSWCRVAGVWRNESTDAEGPALEIQRMALRDLAQRGWHEAISVGLASVYTPIPHGLAAEWSWEPGTDGAGNQLRYGTW